MQRNQAFNVVMLNHPKQVFQTYPGQVLVGVYDVRNGQIMLMPCIPDKVWLVQNSNGEYSQGWEINNLFQKKRELTAQEISTYNSSKFAPRLCSNDSDVEKYYSSHEYLLKSLGLSENDFQHFRGFSVTPGNPPSFEWVSGALNSPRDEQGKLIKRIRGAKMDSQDQSKVMNNVERWGTVLSIKHMQLPPKKDVFKIELMNERGQLIFSVTGDNMKSAMDKFVSRCLAESLKDSRGVMRVTNLEDDTNSDFEYKQMLGKIHLDYLRGGDYQLNHMVKEAYHTSTNKDKVHFNPKFHYSYEKMNPMDQEFFRYRLCLEYANTDLSEALIRTQPLEVIQLLSDHLQKDQRNYAATHQEIKESIAEVRARCREIIKEREALRSEFISIKNKLESCLPNTKDMSKASQLSVDLKKELDVIESDIKKGRVTQISTVRSLVQTELQTILNTVPESKKGLGLFKKDPLKELRIVEKELRTPSPVLATRKM